jgi:hypothetical protein
MAKTAKKKKATPRKPTPKTTDGEIDKKRAKAYAEMENSVCEIVRMGEIAAMLFDDPDPGRFVFAVDHLEWMLQRFKKRYYAVEFPACEFSNC